ncbi:GTPase Era [uncultured Campylobacter sp.]|uniref:GTPase Era n=1 Tax=uncultured Campylobacter sp. TaxID=218934 RepID=UPI00260C6B4A|nr:GTPase Era [uncultured Campylobacter sp.]
MSKSGFVSLIGRTNAGKSSLINYLLGQKICMVSHKQNATRRKITAIVMHDEAQIIFSDTPGLHESNKTLNKAMVELALGSVIDADLVLFLAVCHDDVKNYEKFLAKFPTQKHILVLTKIDEMDEKKLFQKIGEYSKFDDKFLALVPVSIKKQAYRKILLDEIVKHIDENPYFYPPEFISTKTTKEIYRDLILEAVFDSLSSEIPYAVDVMVDKVEDKDEIVVIYATIITSNENHKKMVIGKDGGTIKRVGIRAKKLICKFEERKIYLNLTVKVKKMWNIDENLIKKEFVY